MARSAAALVAGLPQPLINVIPSLARSAPASPANSYAAEPGSALPKTHTWGRRMDLVMPILLSQPDSKVVSNGNAIVPRTRVMRLNPTTLDGTGDNQGIVSRGETWDK